MTLGRVIPTAVFASLLCLLTVTSAHAQVTTPTTLPTQTTVLQNILVTGASNYDNTTNPAQPVIFAGYTGPYGDCAGSPTGTCNACTALTNVCDTSGNVVFSCAENSISPNGILQITFTAPANAPIGGTVVLRPSASTSGSLTFVNTPTVSPNSAVTVQLQWGTICNAYSNTFNGGGCTVSGNTYGGISDSLTLAIADASGNILSGLSQQLTLKISYVDAHYNLGLTPNGSTMGPTPTTGFQPGCSSGSPFCDFTLGSGDEKVYVNGPTVNSNGPNDGAGLKWKTAKFYFAPYGSCDQSGCTAPGTNTGFCTVNLASASFADLDVANRTADYTQFTLSSSTIKGLANDQPYIFLMASQDEASIVTGFMDSGQFLANTSCTGDFNTAVNGGCPYLGFPGKVVGLLSDQKCFIATAAYGSPMEPHVMVLRHFRNKFLLTNTIGTWFVHTYYHFSPPFAQWISEHETARAIARAALWPAVWFAEWMTGETAPDPAKVLTTPGARK